MRLAFWRIDLGGRGPGYALQDILARDRAVLHKAELIAHIAPDVLVLSGLDHDHDLVALRAFRDVIAEKGHVFTATFAFSSNAGLRTGRDMTGDGRHDTADDTQGYGRFRGERALALLSNFPVDDANARDFSQFLWRDLPGALLPEDVSGAVLADEVLALQRLSSTGHWDVPILIDGQSLHLLIYQAGPPVFGGRGTRNLHRNHDETAFWTHFLDNRLPMAPPEAPLVVIGGSNLDPFDGDGLHGAMRDLLAHPALQDPQPQSAGGRLAAHDPPNAAHLGPPELDTVHWPQRPGPGNLRVSYILPSSELRVRASGVFWPATESAERARLGDPDAPPTRHRLVWVDLDRDSLRAVGRSN